MTLFSCQLVGICMRKAVMFLQDHLQPWLHNFQSHATKPTTVAWSMGHKPKIPVTLVSFCLATQCYLSLTSNFRFASSKSARLYLHTDIRVIFARQPPDLPTGVTFCTVTDGPTEPKYTL